MAEILVAKKAPEKVVNKFIRDTKRVQIPFKQVISAIKTREGRIWELRKNKERQDKLDTVNNSPGGNTTPGKGSGLKRQSMAMGTAAATNTSSRGKLSFVVNNNAIDSKIKDFNEAERIIKKSRSLESNNNLLADESSIWVFINWKIQKVKYML